MTQLMKCLTQHITYNIPKELLRHKILKSFGAWQSKQQQSLFAVKVIVQIYLLDSNLLRYLAIKMYYKIKHLSITFFMIKTDLSIYLYLSIFYLYN